jgi:hypothetical protein
MGKHSLPFQRSRTPIVQREALAWRYWCLGASRNGRHYKCTRKYFEPVAPGVTL